MSSFLSRFLYTEWSVQTPLNNNIRELFNLMNFLDPTEWKDLEALAKEHEVLDEEKVRELHARLRPYFLRRIKSEVLELPPKVCQRRSFRSESNADHYAERSYRASQHESATAGGVPFYSQYVMRNSCWLILHLYLQARISICCKVLRKLQEGQVSTPSSRDRTSTTCLCNSESKFTYLFFFTQY